MFILLFIVSARMITYVFLYIYSDPHNMAVAYENFVRDIKKININAQDTGNWQQSASQMHGIDESKSTDYTNDQYSAQLNNNMPSTPKSPPSTQLHGRYSSGSSIEFNRSESNPLRSKSTKTKPKPKAKKSGIFSFGRKKSSEKIAYSVPINNKHEKALSADNYYDNNNGHRNGHKTQF